MFIFKTKPSYIFFLSSKSRLSLTTLQQYLINKTCLIGRGGIEQHIPMEVLNIHCAQKF